MPSTDDPLTQVYNALWDMLEAHEGFTDLVKIGNRMKFAGDVRDPERLEELTADRPNVGILADGGTPRIGQTSSSTLLVAKYLAIVVTGDKRVSAELYPVTWEMFRAMHTWQTHLRALTWQSHTFVHLARPMAYRESLPDDQMKNIKGWVATWEYEVQINVPLSIITPS